MSWDLSCPDWEQRIRTGRSLVPDLPLDLAQGNRAVAVFNKLRLSDVPGTPTMEEAGGDWFRDIVRALFGSSDPVTRERMIRELFLLVPKKNSKTTSGALLMLTALLLNERPHASMIMTAPVQDVTQLAYDAASGAISLDPVLEKKLYVRDHLKTIVHRDTKAHLKIMSFDPASLTGQKPVAALIDELHVVSKMNKAPSAIRQLRGGMIPYPEAFMAFITTQSEEPPAGVFRAELIKAREIRDGKRRGAMLPVLYEFPADLQASKRWQEPEHWHMVTPNLGRSITLKRLREDMQAAKDTSEDEYRVWSSQHLNVEIGLALRSDAWAGAEYWESRGISLTLEEILRRSEVVTAGIDGGGLDDMLSLAVIGREEETGLWLHWARAWIHPIAMERRKSESQKYKDLAESGDLVIVEAIGKDIEQVAQIVEQCEDSELLDRVGVDPVGIGSIVDAIQGTGIEHDRIVGIPQGWKLNGSIKATERRLAEGSMVHCNSPLMSYAVGNAKVEPRGNAITITKQASGTAKIDPLMATFSAAALMAMNPEPRKRRFQMFFAG